MWDFSFGKAVSMVMRTMPFVVLRLLVYFGIGIAYLFATGTGAAIGYGFGRFTTSPEGGAFWGGLIGFGLASAALYLAREYILYLVKAAHIAVLVELYDDHRVPTGQGQLGFGGQYVRTHFATSSVLFGVDQIIKAVLRTFFRTINFFTAFLPIPALQSLIRLAENIVRLSLTYVDEIILAYLIRTRTTNPWSTAKDGLILYGQNYRHFLKNAIWLAVLLWLLTAAIFIVLIGPAVLLIAFMPGQFTIWAFAIAFVFAWALKAAVLEPVAIASLMQVYFKTIEGQKPDPEWEARLDGVSRRFRELGDRAAGWPGGNTAVTPTAKPA
jgi:hypothetical protein